MPAVPDMNEMPNASRPEKAPASVAPPKNIPTRYCSMWRGYHSERLRARQHFKVRDDDVRRGVHLLVDDSGEETGFCDAEAYTRADELWVAGRKHDQWSLSTL